MIKFDVNQDNVLSYDEMKPYVMELLLKQALKENTDSYVDKFIQ